MRRSLSGFEKAFCLSEPLVPINFSLVACFASKPDETALRLALSRLHERYSMAALRLDHAENGEPFFTDAGVPDFPLWVTEHTPDGDWQQVTARELGKNFDLANGPLIRTVLLKQSANSGADLVLTFHHGIADGMSAFYFLRDLLSLLHDPQADLPVMTQLPDLLGLIPEKAKRSLSLKVQTVGMKSGLWLMRHFPPLERVFPSADRLINGRPPWQHFGLTSCCLTQAQTTRLLSLCKERGTSIHAAICTAWLLARSGTNPGIKNWKRSISSPVNLRGMLNAENTFGMCMSSTVVSVDCNPNRDFWDIAREIKIRINQDIQTGRVYRWTLTMIGLMDSSSGAMRRAIPTFSTQPVHYDFSISNLGKLSLPARNDSLTVDAVYGPIVNTSEQEITVGVSTVCDQLTMTLTYRDFVLDPVEAKKMTEKVVEILGKAAG